jgi:hypothetical protein
MYNSSTLLQFRRLVGYSFMEFLKSAVILVRGLLGRLGGCARYHCLQTYKSSNFQKNLGIPGMCISVKRGSIKSMDLAQINYDSGLEQVFAGNSLSAKFR